VRVTFVSDKLDGMPSGTVELSVPVIGGVIQIGAGGDVDVGRIRVFKDPGTVTVAQVNGAPMQVEIVLDNGQKARSAVFEESVEVLRLKRCTDASGRVLWSAAEPVNVTHPDRLKQFADIIGVFGAAKQDKLAKR